VPSLADLSEAGGWAIFALSVVWAAIALQRRWIVPGWIYLQEWEQRHKAEIQAERNSEALALLAKTFADARRDAAALSSRDAP
jgi:hypothetical protein